MAQGDSSQDSASERNAQTGSHISKEGMRALALGALGVVYGDIGTSPLYAVKESFFGSHPLSITPENVIGILSLFFWSLMIVVVLKYLTLIMMADNKGEGGITALLALLTRKSEQWPRWVNKRFVISLGLFAAALLYGDGIITPAISVLSAVEGLTVATPIFQPYVVPLTVAILIGLFTVQKGGTSTIGRLFGPATLIWFVSIAVIAAPWIFKQPRILLAANPLYALDFIARNGFNGFLILGSVVLCITGAEALYADMGHFGRHPIRVAWYTVVFPALLINYFGQGALLLERGAEAGENPFFAMTPSFFLYPMVFIATIATIVASQALISGAFSLTQQAIQLGYLPRVPIVHTSELTEGQIYIPRVNQFLMLSCLALVLVFQESTHLAAAYGIAVTGTMTITSILFYVVTRARWNWPVWKAAPIVGFFFVIDLAFLTANISKLHHGGWVPIVIGIFIYINMSTWRRGREVLSQLMVARSIPLQEFTKKIDQDRPLRVPGSAIFMTANQDVAPGVLLHHYRHNKVLHERVVLLTVVIKHVPAVPFWEHARVTELEHGIMKVVATYGYMQKPNIAEILTCCQIPELKPDQANISFYLGRETLLTTGPSRMAQWRKKLFAFLTRNSQPATAFFEISPNQVIEVGLQLEL